MEQIQPALIAENSTQAITSLPPELLKIIFEFLPPFRLLQIRLVCRQWRDVVTNNSSLIGKFFVKFHMHITMDEHFVPKYIPAAVPAVRFMFANIVKLPTWWWSFGQNLTELQVKYTKASLPTLLKMLKSTPNLKKLVWFDVTFTKFKTSEPNFVLNKLNEQFLDFFRETNMFSVYGPICPNLKEFHLLLSKDNHYHENQVVLQFLQTVQTTLESLVLYTTRQNLVELSTLKKLRLKRLVYNWIADTEKELIQFCHNQPSIEYLLTMQAFLPNSTLSEIGHNLPNLKHLRTIHCSIPSKSASFLNTMPKLEQLSLSNNSEIDFSDCQSPNLKKLKLSCHQTTRNSLQQYLAGCPNLRSLKLETCAFDSWEEVFGAISSLQSLRTVELSNLDLENVTDATFERMAHLQRLKLGSFKMTHRVMAALFQACSQLRLIELNGRTLNEEEALKSALPEDLEWRSMTLGWQV